MRRILLPLAGNRSYYINPREVLESHLKELDSARIYTINLYTILLLGNIKIYITIKVSLTVGCPFLFLIYQPH